MCKEYPSAYAIRDELEYWKSQLDRIEEELGNISEAKAYINYLEDRLAVAETIEKGEE